MMATISRLQVYCYGFFTPRKKSAISSLQKKESDIFYFIFPRLESGLVGVPFRTFAGHYFCRCFLIVACDGPT
jgi:hypothetical protein